MIELFKTLIADFHARGVSGKIFPRELEVPMDVPKIISVIGPRRAGKTCFMFSLIKRLQSSVDIRRIVYVNFEDERLSPEMETPSALIDAYQQMYPDQQMKDVYFFLDEIQEMKGWEKFVRRVVDTMSPHVFITGSSAKLLGREIATSLRGRTLAYTLMPLSFREYLRFEGVEWTDISGTAARNRIESHFDRFLSNGGYPETAGFDEATRLRTLQSYFDVMLYRDVVERYSIRRPRLVKDFARRLMSGNANVFSIHKFYRELRSRNVRVTKDALYAMAEHFSDAYFVIPVNKFDPSHAKQGQALKKYYVNDTGLLNACVAGGGGMGALLETFVLLEIRKKDKSASYYSDTGECDFVLHDRGTVSNAVQVCWDLNSENRQREINGLSLAMKRFGLKQGLILTRRQRDEIKLEQGIVQVMPAWGWALAVTPESLSASGS